MPSWGGASPASSGIRRSRCKHLSWATRSASAVKRETICRVSLPCCEGRSWTCRCSSIIFVTEPTSYPIPEDELEERFIRASGPGGQNVNKVATAVQLRFNVAASKHLSAAVKQRLVRLAGRRMTEEG